MCIRDRPRARLGVPDGDGRGSGASPRWSGRGGKQQRSDAVPARVPQIGVSMWMRAASRSPPPWAPDDRPRRGVRCLRDGADGVYGRSVPPQGWSMFGLKMGELLIIFLVILVLFGGTKLPQLGSSLGQAIRNFKRGFGGDAAADAQG